MPYSIQELLKARNPKTSLEEEVTRLSKELDSLVRQFEKFLTDSENLKSEIQSEVRNELGKVESQAGILQHVESLKGLKGDNPTDEELLALIRPLIPEVQDGKTPTDDELLKLIRPLIPKVQDGHTPTREELSTLIRPLIPEVKNGYTPQKGVDYFDGENGSPDTTDQVIEKVHESKKLILYWSGKFRPVY